MNRLRALSIYVSAVILFSFVLAITTVSAASPDISRSFKTSGAVPNGSLVSEIPSQIGVVQAANTDNSQHLVGIAIASNQSLIEVNPTSSTIQVATDGTVSALVSTVNGPISSGDQIAVSPFNGVGMKAGDSETWIVGQSQSSFNANSPGAYSVKVTNTDGHSEQILVGFVKLSIAIGHGGGNVSNLNGLQRFFDSLTGHPISTLRIVIALIVTFVSLVSIITLIYTSIYGTIISIGRNPLAKYAVFRTLSSVLGMTLLIAAVSSATIFLLLF
jgi:hypothetical protein